MFRGAENALPPNWLHIPIGYNGRASSVVVSGTDIIRPWGQSKRPMRDMPRLRPLPASISSWKWAPSSARPRPWAPITRRTKRIEMIFGYVLLNDWSARDIQAWEYQPLGPFQAKATATSISPGS